MAGTRSHGNPKMAKKQNDGGDWTDSGVTPTELAARYRQFKLGRCLIQDSVCDGLGLKTSHRNIFCGCDIEDAFLDGCEGMRSVVMARLDWLTNAATYRRVGEGGGVAVFEALKLLKADLDKIKVRPREG